MSTTTATTDAQLPDFVSLRAIGLGSGLAVFCIFTILGNLLVVVSVCIESYLNITTRHLRTATNYLIVSLSLADLLIGVLVMPFSISLEMRQGEWRHGGVWCDVWHSLDVLASTASILNLSVISLDRYWAITDPISYPRKMSKKRSLVLMAVVWALSFAISFPAILWWKYTSPSPKPPPAPEDSFQDWTRTTSIVVPSFILSPSALNSFTVDSSNYSDTQSFLSIEPSDIESQQTLQPFLFKPDSSTPSESANITSERLYFTTTNTCLFTEDPIYLIASSIVSFYLPMVVIFYTYYHIYKAALRQKRSLLSGTISMESLYKKNLNVKSKNDVCEINKRVNENSETNNCSRLKLFSIRFRKGNVLKGKLESMKTIKTQTNWSRSMNNSLEGSMEKRYCRKKNKMHFKFIEKKLFIKKNHKNQINKNVVSEENKSENPFIKKKEMVLKGSGKRVEKGSSPSRVAKTARGAEEVVELRVHKGGYKEARHTKPQINWKRYRDLEECSSSSIFLGVDLINLPFKNLSTTPRNDGLAVLLNNKKNANSDLKRKIMKTAKERKAAKTLGVVVGVFCGCCMPFFVTNLLFGLCNTQCVPHASIIFPIFTWLAYSNSCMNPVIYAYSMRDFRRSFIRIIFCRLRRTC